MLDSHTADISRASCHQDRHAIPLFSSITLEGSHADESNAKNALSAVDIHLNVGPRLRAGHDTIYLKTEFNFSRFLYETTCYRAAWPQGRTHGCC
jgi:hypothetical protein